MSKRSEVDVSKLKEIFPEASVDVVDLPFYRLVDVAQDEDKPIIFKFKDMDMLADVLKTTKLDFQQWNGDYLVDSVTWNGFNVLRIIARY